MPIRSNLAFKSEFPTCSICNESMELETTSVNEIGEPVHEECYAIKVNLKKATTIPSNASAEDTIGLDHPLSVAIIDFLDSASTRPSMTCCPECGSQLEYGDCTFFYEGQTWEIPLPICVKCLPGAEVATDEAETTHCYEGERLDVFTVPSAATREAALVSSDRRDNRADHTCRASIPVNQKDHDKK
jgi:hypothetical protein